MDGFNLGMDVGAAEERQRHEERETKFREREEHLRRLADASEASSNGDRRPMDELMREWGYDDLLDVADEAGVTPMSPPDGVDVEQWAAQGVDALEAHVNLPGDPAGTAQGRACPTWCTVDHTDPKEARAEAVCELRQHVRTVAVILRDGETVAQVDIVAVDSFDTGRRSPDEVMLAEARDTYSPDEADRIAAAIVEAARIIRDEPGGGEVIAEIEAWLRGQGGQE